MNGQKWEKGWLPVGGPIWKSAQIGRPAGTQHAVRRSWSKNGSAFLGFNRPVSASTWRMQPTFLRVARDTLGALGTNSATHSLSSSYTAVRVTDSDLESVVRIPADTAFNRNVK
jgi:hypothetical protein